MMPSANRGKLAQSSTSSLMRQADVAVGTRETDGGVSRWVAKL